jgi:hypothetical protein
MLILFQAGRKTHFYLLITNKYLIQQHFLYQKHKLVIFL